MKKMIVLKVESEKGEQYSIEFDVGKQIWVDALDIFFNGFPHVNCPSESVMPPLKNKHKLDMVLNSPDELLVGMALDTLTSNLTNEQLNNLCKKFEKSELVQYCILGYCHRKRKNNMVKQFCESRFDNVCDEAKVYLEELKK